MPTGPELPILNVVSPPAADRRLPPWLKRLAADGQRKLLHAKPSDRTPAGNGLRERQVPQPHRVLVAADRHVHDPGQRLHSAVRLLLGEARKTRPPAADEPERVAEAAFRLGLKHVVITSVTRDDLPDGGADTFAAASWPSGTVPARRSKC